MTLSLTLQPLSHCCLLEVFQRELVTVHLSLGKGKRILNNPQVKADFCSSPRFPHVLFACCVWVRACARVGACAGACASCVGGWVCLHTCGRRQVCVPCACVGMGGCGCRCLCVRGSVPCAWAGAGTFARVGVCLVRGRVQVPVRVWACALCVGGCLVHGWVQGPVRVWRVLARSSSAPCSPDIILCRCRHPI